MFDYLKKSQISNCRNLFIILVQIIFNLLSQFYYPVSKKETQIMFSIFKNLTTELTCLVIYWLILGQ